MTGTKSINKGSADALKPKLARLLSWNTAIPGCGARVYPSVQKVCLLKCKVGMFRAFPTTCAPSLNGSSVPPRWTVWADPAYPIGWSNSSPGLTCTATASTITRWA